MSFRSKQFKNLEKVWYEKLKADGFEDIEDCSRDDRPIKAWHGEQFRNTDPLKFGLTELYYYRAKELLHSYKFKNKTHRKIWQLHSEGKSKRQIEALIRHYVLTYKRESIGNIINKIAKEIK